MKSQRIKILGLGLVLSVILGSGCTGYNPGELTRLADEYGSDKGSKGHGYTEVYEHFFYPKKYEARKIFEIGVFRGAPMKMFRDFFPKAIIYGIDIVDTSSLDSNKMKTFIVDQANRKQLKDFIDTHGYDFDIILDDGGHSMEQQQVSFGYLFRYLKSGGYYIIEDVHTSIPEYYPGYGVEENEENTTLVMINNFIRSGRMKSKYMTPEGKNYLTANIEYCDLLSRNSGKSVTCIFKKKDVVSE